ncbi:MAG: hypothetical protein LBB52_04940 [Desulfovibrio sp.]|nr:hypothetical protein [Desulfovibrio sp.]
MNANAEVFEKQVKPDFSKTCGRQLRHRHASPLSIEANYQTGIRRARGTAGNRPAAEKFSPSSASRLNLLSPSAVRRKWRSVMVQRAGKRSLITDFCGNRSTISLLPKTSQSSILWQTTAECSGCAAARVFHPACSGGIPGYFYLPVFHVGNL